MNAEVVKACLSSCFNKQAKKQSINRSINQRGKLLMWVGLCINSIGPVIARGFSSALVRAKDTSPDTGEVGVGVSVTCARDNSCLQRATVSAAATASVNSNFVNDDYLLTYLFSYFNDYYEIVSERVSI